MFRSSTGLPFAVFAVAALAGAASGTTYSSFNVVNAISGITVTPQGAGAYNVSVSLNPTFTITGNTYQVTDVIGFYGLNGTGDYSPLPTLPTLGSFKDDSTNSGPGSIAGWKSNPNQGLTPGQSKVFTFTGLNTSQIQEFGFHVRLNGTFPGTSGNTGNIRVPAPGAGTLAACGLLIVARRRRR